jgi:elongator complex protein 3
VFQKFDLDVHVTIIFTRYPILSLLKGSSEEQLPLSTEMPVAQPNQAETYLLACTSIVRDLIEAVSNPDPKKEINLNALRKQYGKKYKMKGVPRLVDILSAVPEEWRDRLRGALRAKPVRTASGVGPACLREIREILTGWHLQVAVVAVMCKPHRCPHVAMTGNICV